MLLLFQQKQSSNRNNKSLSSQSIPTTHYRATSAKPTYCDTMMEEINFFDDPPTNSVPETTTTTKTSNQSASSSATSTSTSASTANNSSPLRLPRTTGAGRIGFLQDALKAQIPTTEAIQKTQQRASKVIMARAPTTAQIQNTKKQAGRVLKGFGKQLNKLNLGKIIDKMEQDQGLADSLEQLNDRMKEEVQRQEVRREAEELTLKVITDHLGEFLEQHPNGTYEEWIQDLHPENANQGQLLSDIQQIDERFYVMESDHRKLWNEAVEKQESEKDNDGNADPSRYAHRIVQARTQIWGKAPGNTPKSSGGYSDANSNAAVDFLSATTTTIAAAPAAPVPPTKDTIDLFGSDAAPTTNLSPAPPRDTGVETIDFFAPVAPPPEPSTVGTASTGGKKDPFQDLIQF